MLKETIVVVGCCVTSPTFWREHLDTCVLFWQFFCVVKASHRAPRAAPGASEVMDYSCDTQGGEWRGVGWHSPNVWFICQWVWQGWLPEVNSIMKKNLMWLEFITINNSWWVIINWDNLYASCDAFLWANIDFCLDQTRPLWAIKMTHHVKSQRVWSQPLRREIKQSCQMVCQ